MSGPLVVVGDALLDRDVEGVVERLCPEAPVPVVDELAVRARPGGAALAAALAAADGHEVVLVAAVGRDGAARELRTLLSQAGVQLVPLPFDGDTPEKLRVRADEHLLLRIDRGGRERPPVGPLTREAEEALASARAVLVADYGRGLTERADVRRALASAARRTPLVWDPHPRGAEPVAGARLVTPNQAEAALFAPDVVAGGEASAEERARLLCGRWSAAAVAVTLGSLGAVLVEASGAAVRVPARSVHGGDPCGAGDRFAVTAAELLADGASVPDAVAAAVAGASAFVAAGGAGALSRPHDDDVFGFADDDAALVIARVRAARGTVVATGGCFDLLHAGHVAMLQAARSLGDCLVVCLNSDDSVRRLKGPDRPLVAEDDRAAVLRALTAVDAVVVFDEDTPRAVLEQLRPDVWVKGGDYAAEELAETPLVRSWGGEVVIVPYVEGRSTTRLIEELRLVGD